MKRSVLNSVYFALVFSVVINGLAYLILKELSLWNGLVIIILFMLIKAQNYLYEKGERIYYRRVPFFRGIPIDSLKSPEDLRLIDTSSNIVNLWQLIKLKTMGKES